MAMIWSAAYSGDEKVVGSIEECKLADLVVLGGDYMTVPEEKISESPVDCTIVGGKTYTKQTVNCDQNYCLSTQLKSYFDV